MANVLTNVALAQMIAGIAGTGAPKYIAWGTGTTAAAVTDTALTTESAETRVAGTVSTTTTTVTNDTLQVVGTMTSASAQSISEAGILDASTTGNLYIHGVFTAIALATGDSIAFTFTIQQT